MTSEVTKEKLEIRISRFMKYLKKKTKQTVTLADGSGSSWNHGAATAMEQVMSRAKNILSGTEDKD